MGDLDLQKLHITKLDAARRQLETAITLWFHDGDPVSIHTLAAAAYQIIYDLNVHRGGPPMMRDSHSIRPEYLPEWRKIMSEHQNFFKHADRDPKETVFFPARITQAFILEAVDKYAEMAHERRPLFDVFTCYLAYTQPRLFKADLADKLRSLMSEDLLSDVTKREFFQYALPFFTKIESP